MDEWTKKIHALVNESQKIPMWGAVPAFPWENFNKHLSTGLNLSDLSVSAGSSAWRVEDDLLSGLGEHVRTLSIELSPLAHPLHIVVPAEDLERISSWLIPEGGFTDPDLQQGFYHYLCLQALHAVNSIQILKNLSPKIIEQPFSKQDSYCVDLAMTCQGMTSWGRLILSKSFQESLTKHYLNYPLALKELPLSESISLSISLEGGKTLLTQTEFLSLSEGDFLILDQTHQRLSLSGKPLFEVLLNKEGAQIIQFATLEEEFTMVNEESPTYTSDIPTLNPSEVPILLTVEMARLEMPLSHLLSLKPGNVVELGTTQTSHVSLTVHGKCVAKGELIKIGEVTGVKLTEVGHG
jgi:type III secretion system YscQ/HrcQ family protein